MVCYQDKHTFGNQTKLQSTRSTSIALHRQKGQVTAAENPQALSCNGPIQSIPLLQERLSNLVFSISDPRQVPSTAACADSPSECHGAHNLSRIECVRSQRVMKLRQRRAHAEDACEAEQSPLQHLLPALGPQVAVQLRRTHAVEQLALPARLSIGWQACGTYLRLSRFQSTPVDCLASAMTGLAPDVMLGIAQQQSCASSRPWGQSESVAMALCDQIDQSLFTQTHFCVTSACPVF